MTNQHPIVPSHEQVDQWFDDAVRLNSTPKYYIATQAAQWGADHDEDSFMVRVKDVERHHEENEKLVNQSYLDGWEDGFFGRNIPLDECKETGDRV